MVKSTVSNIICPTIATKNPVRFFDQVLFQSRGCFRVILVRASQWLGDDFIR